MKRSSRVMRALLLLLACIAFSSPAFGIRRRETQEVKPPTSAPAPKGTSLLLEQIKARMEKSKAISEEAEKTLETHEAARQQYELKEKLEEEYKEKYGAQFQKQQAQFQEQLKQREMQQKAEEARRREQLAEERKRLQEERTQLQEKYERQQAERSSVAYPQLPPIRPTAAPPTATRPSAYDAPSMYTPPPQAEDELEEDLEEEEPYQAPPTYGAPQPAFTGTRPSAQAAPRAPAYGVSQAEEELEEEEPLEEETAYGPTPTEQRPPAYGVSQAEEELEEGEEEQVPPAYEAPTYAAPPAAYEAPPTQPAYATPPAYGRIPTPPPPPPIARPRAYYGAQPAGIPAPPPPPGAMPPGFTMPSLEEQQEISAQEAGMGLPASQQEALGVAGVVEEPVGPSYGAPGIQPPAYGAPEPAPGMQPPAYGAPEMAPGMQPPAYGAPGMQPPAYGAPGMAPGMQQGVEPGETTAAAFGDELSQANKMRDLMQKIGAYTALVQKVQSVPAGPEGDGYIRKFIDGVMQIPYLAGGKKAKKKKGIAAAPPEIPDMSPVKMPFINLLKMMVANQRIQQLAGIPGMPFEQSALGQLYEAYKPFEFAPAMKEASQGLGLLGKTTPMQLQQNIDVLTGMLEKIAPDNTTRKQGNKFITTLQKIANKIKALPAPAPGMPSATSQLNISFSNLVKQTQQHMYLSGIGGQKLQQLSILASQMGTGFNVDAALKQAKGMPAKTIQAMQAKIDAYKNLITEILKPPAAAPSTKVKKQKKQKKQKY